MKRFIIFVLGCLLIYGSYYFYKRSKRIVYHYEMNYEPGPVNQIDSVKYWREKYNLLLEMDSSDENSINELNYKIDQLRKENASLRKQLIQKQPELVSNPNNKFRNEKSLPIARSNSAIELQNFFTNRYGNKR